MTKIRKILEENIPQKIRFQLEEVAPGNSLVMFILIFRRCMPCWEVKSAGSVIISISHKLTERTIIKL